MAAAPSRGQRRCGHLRRLRALHEAVPIRCHLAPPRGRRRRRSDGRRRRLPRLRPVRDRLRRVRHQHAGGDLRREPDQSAGARRSGCTCYEDCTSTALTPAFSTVAWMSHIVTADGSKETLSWLVKVFSRKLSTPRNFFTLFSTMDPSHEQPSPSILNTAVSICSSSSLL